MATVKEIAEISDAMRSIPGKKERLRESLRVLKSFSSATFNLDWEDIDEHFSAIEKSIHDQYDALGAKLFPFGQSRNKSSNISNKNDRSSEKDVNPRPRLKSLCIRMDAMGLISYVASIRPGDLDALTKELAPALRFAPDPAQLVVNAVEGFYEGSRRGSSVHVMVRRSCIILLENLQLISPEIGPAVREKALVLAAEWKDHIRFNKVKERNLEIGAFLQLIASYNLVANYDHDYILELITKISCWKNAAVLIKNLGLSDKLAEVIQKLSSNRRQLDAIRIVYACDVVKEFPPVPLLKSYINDSDWTAEETMSKGNYKQESQRLAATKQIIDLQSALNAIKECKLENEYPCEGLKKRISQLGQQLADISPDIQYKQAGNRQAAAGTSVIVVPLNTDYNNISQLGHQLAAISPSKIQYNQVSNRRQQSTGTSAIVVPLNADYNNV